MLVAGGWTYQAIIDTAPELRGQDRHRARARQPPSSNTAFAGGSHLVVFKESESPDLATAFVDFMLKPAELNKFTNGVGFLPGTTAGIESSGYLEDPIKKPFAGAAARAFGGLPAVAALGRARGRERLDGEIQKVMQGEQSAQEAVKSLATKMNEEFAG